ncbi:MAG: hypothetical protein H0T91_08460 [Propionibacteriaceae bacterium]|nr:hypothetical protein [Propionibacteriaceae bacterium]
MTTSGSAGPATPVAARPRAARILRAVFSKVVAEPIRTGMLRRENWPPGLNMIAVVSLVAYLAATQLVLWSSAARQHFRLAVSGTLSVPQALLPAMVCLTVLALALLVAGALHAPVPVRIAGQILSGLVLSTGAGYAVEGVWSVAFLVPASAWLALLALQVVRWRHGFVWWEFPVVLVLLLAGLVTPLALVIRNRLLGDEGSALTVIWLSVLLISAVAVPTTMVAGVALTEVAFRTALWSVEVVSSEVGVRSFGIILGVLGVGSLASLIWGLAASDALLSQQVLDYGGSAVVALLIGVLWFAVDTVADRRAPGSTRVNQLPDDLRRIGLLVAITLGSIIVAAVASVEVGAFLSLPIETSFPESGAAELGTAIMNLFSHDDLLDGVVAFAAAGGCLFACVWQARRARRGPAELLAAMSVFLVLRGLRFTGVVRWPYSLDALGGVAVGVCLVLGLRWLVARELTARRREALAVCLLLALAVNHRELLSDPFGAVLGLAGGAALLFGLLWNLLTGSEDANAESRTFPRESRVLLVIGNITLGMTVLAVNC